MGSRVDIATAADLLNFAAGASEGVVDAAVAESQLEGAVALHNLLHDQGVAYLADEVGMGKTYVALGVIALFRHFDPHFRVVVLAPRENIQVKWIKEWRHFVEKIVRVEDLRVKSVGGQPARALVKVNTLADLVTEASNDPDRDFITRLTSFSLAMSSSDGSLNRRREQLLRALPKLDPKLLNATNVERYKRNFGRAVNAALPPIDLLIIDEAHNLKAGWRDGKQAIRNTVIGCALGGRAIADEDSASFPGYGRKVKRVLMLSATPIETDIRQLWNQLDLLGFGGDWGSLRDRGKSAAEHREVARRLLIRRTNALHVAGKPLTKTEYRREWRRGGISVHDEPLAMANPRQKLAVALIQKKVSELLASGRYNHSFQVGLLASFESFLETVKNDERSQGAATQNNGEEDAAEDGLFHRSSEEAAAARDKGSDGLDVDAVNKIAKHHLAVFGTELPHPKMDAIVDELAKSFVSGRKSLVFVRRVASVDELQRKLEERYDEYLFAKLHRELASDSLRTEMALQIDAYRAQRRVSRHDLRARDANTGLAGTAERSTAESFFAWFFRGEGPDKVRSGATLADGLDQDSGAYSTLLEDNHIAGLLGVDAEQTCDALAASVGRDAASVTELVGRIAGAQHNVGGKLRRRTTMRAVQAAGLSVLAEAGGDVGSRAQHVLATVYPEFRAGRQAATPIPDVRVWLNTNTLFAELRRDRRSDLRQAIWPVASAESFPERMLDQEIRRELMATMLRKGHPIIDIFILIASRLGTLRQRSREDADEVSGAIATELLDLLQQQRANAASGFCSYYELAAAAERLDVITQLNIPDLKKTTPEERSRLLGRTLRAQRPVAGMAGSVNTEVVRQFRMPGYPLVLITTDLLKEGEDLHTFCSDVYHYGIAWMPSELEQRVGRVDRLGSQTARRLATKTTDPDGADKLQVFYPHLSDTVEVLQLRRVYHRLNRFLRMMHEGLGTPPQESADIDVRAEGLTVHQDIEPISEPLKTAFPVAPSMLVGKRRALAMTTKEARIFTHLMSRVQAELEGVGAGFLELRANNQLIGQLQLGPRSQPFTLMLRSIQGHPMLRCVSPVGRLQDAVLDEDEIARLPLPPFARVAVERNPRYQAYDIAIEGDILLGSERALSARSRLLVTTVCGAADDTELALFEADAPLLDMKDGLEAEVHVER